jgi:hypothetical protein
MPATHVCAQCEANAQTNEAGGYRGLADECRAYCRRGHRTPEEAALIARSEQYARQTLINAGRATSEWTDDKLSAALALAFRAGFGAGVHEAAQQAARASKAVR